MCKDYYVVCPDVVGRGDSERLANPMPYAVPQYVSDMATLVKKTRRHSGGLVWYINGWTYWHGVRRNAKFTHTSHAD
ncbi:hypothetical protein [Polynucleobacter necessarius]|uniref:hypothetical protein n=1 Tax=Polynucleobacter necessarius TaxID=576610 RepID=UPI002F9338A4